jgi:hypothetical protein
MLAESKVGGLLVENQGSERYSQFMLIDLPPGFEAAAHAREILIVSPGFRMMLPQLYFLGKGYFPGV